MQNIFSPNDGDPDPKRNTPKKKPRSPWRVLAPIHDNPMGDTLVRPAPSCLVFSSEHFFWAGRNLPIQEATKHLMIAGASGAAKTSTIKLYMQSIVPQVRHKPNEPKHLILSDPKRELIPFLAALGFSPDDEDVSIFNPFDQRSVRWNISETVREPAMARYFANLLIPEEKNSTAPFFPKAARSLTFAAILGLNAASPHQPWSLRDLLQALTSKENILRVSQNSSRATEIVRGILDDEKHGLAVISTLNTKIAEYEEIAALMDANPDAKSFSVEDFLNRPGVLVLGNDPVLNASLKPIVALLIKALIDAILRQPDTLDPRHFWVFDELRSLGKLDCLHDLLTMGRSKGASVLLGLQSIEGLVDIYQQAATDDLLSQCACKTFLRAGGPQTAEWAEKFIGKVRHMEQSYSRTKSNKDTTSTVSYSLRERSVFLASVFLDLPFPVRGGIYRAICDVPIHQQVYIVTRSFDEMLAWIAKPEPYVPALEQITDPAAQSLKPWTDSEKSRFFAATSGGSGTKSNLPKRKSQKKPPEPPGADDLFPPDDINS